jgi:hypothetical protein
MVKIGRKKLIITLIVSAIVISAASWYVYIFSTREIYWSAAEMRADLQGTWKGESVNETVVLSRNSMTWEPRGGGFDELFEMEVKYYPLLGCFTASEVYDGKIKNKYVVEKSASILLEYQSIKGVISYDFFGALRFQRAKLR